MKNLHEKLKQSIGPKLANVAIAFTVMIAWVFGIDFIMSSITPNSYEEANGIVWTFFTAVVVAPLWEELAFRVIPIRVATQLDLKLGTKLLWPIIGLSSIMFGLGHDSFWPFHLLFQGAMGVVFSYLYIKNNYSYWPNVLLHAMWNFFVIFML
jgi:membrane protease YdiL (CAAX protease family)